MLKYGMESRWTLPWTRMVTEPTLPATTNEKDPQPCKLDELPQHVLEGCTETHRSTPIQFLAQTWDETRGS